MKAVTVVGIVVGALALILAIVALAGMPEGAQEVRPEIETLGKGQAAMSSRLDELNVRLDEVAGRISRLQRAVAKARAPAGELDDDKVREILRDEMRAQMERMRRDWQGRRENEGPDALRERVGLDEGKAKRVEEIRNRLREGIRNVWRENRGGDREKNMEATRELQKKAEEEIAGLLTPEEMEKYREVMDRRGRGGRDRGRRDRGRRDREEGRPAGEEGGEGDAF